MNFNYLACEFTAHWMMKYIGYLQRQAYSFSNNEWSWLESWPACDEKSGRWNAQTSCAVTPPPPPNTQQEKENLMCSSLKGQNERFW